MKHKLVADTQVLHGLLRIRESLMESKPLGNVLVTSAIDGKVAHVQLYVAEPARDAQNLYPAWAAIAWVFAAVHHTKHGVNHRVHVLDLPQDPLFDQAIPQFLPW